MWTLQGASEILGVEGVEEFIEIEMAAARPGRRGTDAPAAHASDTAPCAIRTRVFEIRFDECARRFATIDTREEQGGRALKHSQRRATKQVRETDVDGFFAATDGEDEACVWIKVDAKARWTAFATEASKDALKKSGAAGNLRMGANCQLK